MKKYCWFDGEVLPLSKAALSLSDVGVLRGYAVFDFLRTFNKVPFHFEEHYERFTKSAKLIGLKVPLSLTSTKKVLTQLQEANGGGDMSFRFVLTGGPTEDGMSWSKPLFYILAEDLYTLPPDVFKRGASLIIHEHLRQFPHAKTTNYLTAVSLQPKKRSSKAVEILYTERGKVLEASTSNIFIIKRGVLTTPNHSVLSGVTRRVVIALARKAGLTVREQAVTLRELFSADEVFITATNKDITPIVRIDGKKIANGSIGPITRRFMALYKGYTAWYPTTKSTLRLP